MSNIRTANKRHVRALTNAIGRLKAADKAPVPAAKPVKAAN
jgi:hypothetical protein